MDKQKRPVKNTGQKGKEKSTTSIGVFLFSHLDSKALFSALQGLTSVFGMGTGGPPASSTPI